MRNFFLFAFFAFTFSLQAKSVISVDDINPKNGDLGTAISEAIDNASKKNDEIEVVFSKGKTYTFYRSIVVRDHTAIDGNGCIVRFNTQPQTHAMYIYNSFITNRKCVSTDGTIDHFTRTLYATKDITVQNINFECEGDNEFWFNVNSERGIIGLYGVDGLKIENCSFNQLQCNTPIWIGNIKNAEISKCKFIESISNKGQKSSCGAIWTNIGSYLDNVSIHDNEFTNYRDESISIFSDGNESNRYVDKVDIYKNVFNSRYYAITMSAGGASGSVNIHNNIFNEFDNKTNPIALEVGGSYRKVSIKDNQFLRKTDSSVMVFVAKIDIDSLIFEGNDVTNGNITYSYLPTITKYCSIRNNILTNASTILSLSCKMPIYVEKNIFTVINAKNKCLFNINNGQEQDYIRNNTFDIRKSDGVMLLSQYGYGYSECQNRLTFTGNIVNFRQTSTSFFHNDEKGKKITVNISNNKIAGIKGKLLMSRIISKK
jgi:hypothetical protein